MTDFGNRDAHYQALETLKDAVGEQALGPHKIGYLSQDEYATLIYYWAGEEHPAEVAEGVINTLANCSWAHRPQVEGGLAGVVLALCELYPALDPAWRSQYQKLFARVREFRRTPQGNSSWNDFHIAQWFVLRRAHKEEGLDIIDKLLDRVVEGGTVGYDARRACEICAVQCAPFKIALHSGQTARMQARIIQ